MTPIHPRARTGLTPALLNDRRNNEKEINRGCPEEEDVAQQHPVASFAVEGQRADPGDLPEPCVRRTDPSASGRARPAGSTGAARSSGSDPGVAAGSASTANNTPDPAVVSAALGVELDGELVVLALTHRSFAYENGGLPTNERLEFLGDSVLGVIITDVLYRTHPDLPEGRLAKLRSLRGQHARAGRSRPADRSR